MASKKEPFEKGFGEGDFVYHIFRGEKKEANAFGKYWHRIKVGVPADYEGRKYLDTGVFSSKVDDMVATLQKAKERVLVLEAADKAENGVGDGQRSDDGGDESYA